MTASAAGAPPADITLTAQGLGGGGGFGTPEEYLAFLRALGISRFPYSGQPEGESLDAAAAQLGAALAHFLDTFRILHPDGYTGAAAEVRAIVSKMPRGIDPTVGEREIARYAGALAIMPSAPEPKRGTP